MTDIEENALGRVLQTETELEMVEPPKDYGDRLERMYPLRWKHPQEGEDSRLWLRGRSTAMTDPTDLEELFRKQIALAKQQRREKTRIEELKVSRVVSTLDNPKKPNFPL